MAPAPVATANRPLVAPTKQRYFKGKAPEAAWSESDESGEDEEDVQTQNKTKARSALPKPPPPPKDESLVAGGAGRIIKLGDGGVKMNLGAVKVGGVKSEIKREVKVEDEESEEEESDDEDEEPVKPLIKPPGDESSEYETDSEEESEEEKKPAFRPVFIKKGMTQEKAAAMAEEAAKQAEEMEAQRKLDSKELAGETIRRELAEKEVTDLQPDVDDTDGLDPAAEFEEWRARELRRLLREKEAQAARDAEQEEIERRRAMPEEQRMAEDMAYADATRAREKGEMGFLQKYYHKGAFHQVWNAQAQDDDSGLFNRDYTAATESQRDMSLLPQVMQVRNFGKASRTKYTHLTDQDTSFNQGGGSWGKAAPTGYLGDGYKGNNALGIDPKKTGVGEIGTTQTGCWNCGGPHMRKDCPNNSVSNPNGGPANGGGYQTGAGTSANNSELRGNRYGDGGGGGEDRPPRDYGRDRRDDDRGGGSRYRDEGRDRHRDDRSHRDRDRDGGYSDRRDRDSGRDRGHERRNEDYDRHRDRDHGGHRDRDREQDSGRNRDRYRDDRRDERPRERDRDRERERDREKERERDRDRRR